MTPDGTPQFDPLPAAPQTKLTRVLIIGATGVFGSRLAQHLSRDARFELLLASRSLSRAGELADRLGEGSATLTPVVLDTEAGLRQSLRASTPWCIADCSGPFQRMGYGTARAALSAGAHIVDLADAPGYLSGHRDALGQLAQRKRLSAVTGASSTPALSGAVVAHLAQDLREIRDIELAITPGGQSPVGPAVIDAVLSYAGREIMAWRDGKPGTTRGWTGAERVEIGDLPPRRVVPVETYDAAFLGRRHGVRGDITFRAGLESWPEQLGLEALAGLRRSGLVGDLRLLAPVLQRMRQVTRLTTSDRGGMQVRVRGVTENGREAVRQWNLVAERGHGPFVPILPLAAAIKALRAHCIGPGAKIAAEALSLDEILAEAAPYALKWETRGG